MGIFKKKMAKRPSTGKGKIRKILARGRVVDPDPRNRRPKLPIPKKKAPSSPNREDMFKNAILTTRPPQTPVRKAPAKRPPGGGRPIPPAVSTAAPNIKPKVPKPPRGPRTPPPPPAKQPKAVPAIMTPPTIPRLRDPRGGGRGGRDAGTPKKPTKRSKSSVAGIGSSSEAFEQKETLESEKAKKKLKGPGMKKGGLVGGGLAIKGQGKAFLNSKR